MQRHRETERGMALVVTFLAILIFSMMSFGFYFLATGEQGIAASDRDNSVAFYAGEGALEKMSSDLAAFFVSHAAPTPAQVDTLTGPSYRPSFPAVTFPAYNIVYPTNADGTLKSSTQIIGGTGPLAGLEGIVTPFTLTVIAQAANNTEAKLTRVVQEIAVPVFQFGIFSQTDLSFFAGPPFNFGGRVHTNGNLFLAEGGSSTLTLADKVTAYKDVIRPQLSNGWDNTTGYTGTVDAMVTPGSYLPLGIDQGSLIGGPGSPPNPAWPTISLSTYNGNLRTGTTGAKQLNLALALGGDTPIEMLRRPPAGEDPTSTVGNARFYNQASLRILLSDNASALILPDSLSPPVPLDGTLNTFPNPFNYRVDACHPPLAMSPGPPGTPTDPHQHSDFRSPKDTPLLSGFIKIDIKLGSGAHQDVTMEILNQGIEQQASCTVGPNTFYPILHLEQLMPTYLQVVPATPGSTSPYDYIPISLYDPREGEVRDQTPPSSPSLVALGGVMNIIELDVPNLQRWLAGNSGTNGTLALNQSGYIAYVSDRRGNKNPGNQETGEYGFEDLVNPLDSNGIPNGILDVGEDVNGNGTLEVYGGTPRPPAGALPPLDSSVTTNPVTTRIPSSMAQRNRVIFFRRALRLVKGQLGSLPPLATANCSSSTAGGFTVAAENPLYVQGDYNADSVNLFSDNTASGLCHVPAAVIGDAVTLLSNNWQDANSFNFPDVFGNCSSSPNRCARDTYYRTAVIGGKNLSFPRPSWSPTRDFGTDGGVHNFLRYIESWSGSRLNYRGSIVSFYNSRQAVGIYKCCNKVYQPPTRGYAFDIDFQSIGKLPPGTPRFTDVNALSFHQAILSVD